MVDDVDVVADVPCAGASGTVGHETAVRIVAALKEAKEALAKPVKNVEPLYVTPKSDWRVAEDAPKKVSPKVADYSKPKHK